MKIHQSTLGSWLRCGQSYKFRYVDGLKIPPGISARIGSSVHKAAEKNHSSKIITKADLPAAELTAVAADEYTRLIKDDGVFISKLEATTPQDQRSLIGQGKDQAVKSAAFYRATIAPEYQPLYCEEEAIGEIAGIEIAGTVDLIDDQSRIVDLKCHARKSQTWADRAIQPTFYTALYKGRFDKWPESFVYEGIVQNKEIARQQLITRREQKDLDQLERYLVVFLEAIERGIYHPADPQSWICDPRYCGYFQICKYGKGNKA